MGHKKEENARDYEDLAELTYELR